MDVRFFAVVTPEHKREHVMTTLDRSVTVAILVPDNASPHYGYMRLKTTMQGIWFGDSYDLVFPFDGAEDSLNPDAYATVGSVMIQRVPELSDEVPYDPDI